MKKSRFSAEQIVAILNEAAAKEMKVAEVCRKHGIKRWPNGLRQVRRRG